MSKLTAQEKVYRIGTEFILKDAEPFLESGIELRRLAIGESVTGLETLKEGLKASIPVMKGNVRIDMLLIHDLYTKIGKIHAVSPYSGIFDTFYEFIIRLKGRIPYSVAYARAKIKSGNRIKWLWTSETEDESMDNSFCYAMSQIKYVIPRKKKEKRLKLYDAGSFEARFGLGKTIETNWNHQLVPLNRDEYLYILKKGDDSYPFDKTIFDLERFMNCAKAIEDGVNSFSYSGKLGSKEILIPTLSILAVPEFCNDQSVFEHPKYLSESIVPSDTSITKKNNEGSKLPNPLDIAKSRLAAGEISIDEFDRIKAALD